MSFDFRYSILPTVIPGLTSGLFMAGLDWITNKGNISQSLMDGGVLGLSQVLTNALSDILYKSADYLWPGMDNMQALRYWVISPLICGWIYNKMYESSIVSDIGLEYDNVKSTAQNYLYGYASSVLGQYLTAPVLKWLI